MDRWDQVKLIFFSSYIDKRGTLVPVEGNNNIPFSIERIFYIYGVPNDEWRGGHAHVHESQVLIAVSGEFYVDIDDGDGNIVKYALNKPYVGLYVPPGNYVKLHSFTQDAVCLVLSSTKYDQKDFLYLEASEHESEYPCDDENSSVFEYTATF